MGQLESRGYIADGIENNYRNVSLEQRMELLKSPSPTDRTLGARLLMEYPGLPVINLLTGALKTEKKLYPKLEICRTLASFGKDSVVPLVALLGKLGSNQHTRVPAKDFRKTSYPLPRDIAARTLIRIGSVALPDLIWVLNGSDLVRLSEAIDTIGFICFYNYQPGVAGLLEECFYRNEKEELIQWKIFRAMSAFPENIPFLQKQLVLSPELFRPEIKRSLSLLKNKLPDNE